MQCPIARGNHHTSTGYTFEVPAVDDTLVSKVGAVLVEATFVRHIVRYSANIVATIGDDGCISRETRLSRPDNAISTVNLNLVAPRINVDAAHRGEAVTVADVSYDRTDPYFDFGKRHSTEVVLMG